MTTASSSESSHVDAAVPALQSSRTKSMRKSRVDHHRELSRNKSLLAPVLRTTTTNKKAQRGSNVPEGRNPWTRMVVLSESESGDLLLRRISASFPQSKVRRHCHRIYCEVYLTFRTAAKAKLDMQIEAILKPKKGNRIKRKKKDADEELDRYADEEVSRLREAMLAAAADDDQSNKQKLPATTKLKLLPQVLEILRKWVL